jgi:acetyl esterase/lipase
VVSVDYRLAPETCFPGPLDDAQRGLTWLLEHARELGIDRRAVAIGGASAGAGLAAALARRALRQLTWRPALQLLYFPMLDDRMSTVSSRWTVPVWGPKANAWCWRAYLGELDEGRIAEAASGRAKPAELVGLPGAFIAVGGADPFLHEDLAYAASLAAAGVPAELHVYPGAPHGFTSMFAGTTVARQANTDATNALRRAFAAATRRTRRV